MVHKKRRYIVLIERCNGLEKSEIGGKTGMLIAGSANFWYACGASCIAIGSVAITLGAAIKSVAMSPGLAIGYLDLSNFYLLSAVIIFIAALLMIGGAYNIERESEKPPVGLLLKELQHTNKQLFCGILFFISWVFLIVIAWCWLFYHLFSIS